MYEIFFQHLKRNIPTINLNKSTHSSFSPNNINNDLSKYKKTKSANNNKKSSSPAPWWNESCQEAVDLRRLSISIYKANPTYHNYLSFKRQEAIARRVLKSEKRKGWREFCQTLSPRTSITRIWSVVKRFKNRRLEIAKPVSLSNLTFLPEVLSTISSICPPSSLHLTYSSLQELPQNSTQCHSFFSPFFCREFCSVLSDLKIKSSPGLDQIDYKIITSLPESYLDLLLDILNEILTAGLFPPSWGVSLVFLIPKSAPGRFRPISLTSCTLKVLEKLILSRLEWWVESTGILPPLPVRI